MHATQWSRQEFVELKVDGPGMVVEDLHLDRCSFVMCDLGADDSALRRVVRNVTVSRCVFNGCDVKGVYFDEVTVSNLKIRGWGRLFGCVLRHVTLSGQVPGTLSVFPPGGWWDAECRARLDEAIADAYQEVDWALDISGAEFLDVDLRHLPGHLVRRDPETQFLLRKETLDGLDLGHFGPHARGFLAALADSPFDSMVAVAPKRSAWYPNIFEDLEELRKLGLAE
ncbi:hypothetical protein ACQP2T_21335 [Nonomuraea sp. CA-143628]|uniref:hypothetical protein n=1 Tax=Nonomuraea sp. CA-143628 TaxID=3239997 RepID=UPI003D8E7A58